MNSRGLPFWTSEARQRPGPARRASSSKTGGAWTSRVEGLPPEAVPPVIPIKGEIVVLTPPAGADLPKHVVWGNEIYVVPRAGRLLVGATMERAGFDTAKSPVTAALTDALRESPSARPPTTPRLATAPR